MCVSAKAYPLLSCQSKPVITHVHKTWGINLKGFSLNHESKVHQTCSCEFMPKVVHCCLPKCPQSNLSSPMCTRLEDGISKGFSPDHKSKVHQTRSCKFLKVSLQSSPLYAQGLANTSQKKICPVHKSTHVSNNISLMLSYLSHPCLEGLGNTF